MTNDLETGIGSWFVSDQTSDQIALIRMVHETGLLKNIPVNPEKQEEAMLNLTMFVQQQLPKIRRALRDNTIKGVIFATLPDIEQPVEVMLVEPDRLTLLPGGLLLISTMTYKFVNDLRMQREIEDLKAEAKKILNQLLPPSMSSTKTWN